MSDMQLGLASLIAAAEAKAMARGAILPHQIEQVAVDDGELQFLVSWVSSLALKDRAAPSNTGGGVPPANPFLPYEQALYVADLGPTHVLLLNKFQVESGHVLAITRAFQPQQSLLARADVAAICPLFAEIDGLVMYNGGKIAGASQAHRHLHFLPTQRAPLDAMFCEAAAGLQRVAKFRFPHVLVRFGDGLFADPQAAAAQVHAAFVRAAATCGLSEGVDGRSAPYNMLMTRRWMLLVPRTQEYFEAEGIKISVHALHYGGRVSVRQPEHIDIVRRAGLHAILAAGTARA